MPEAFDRAARQEEGGQARGESGKVRDLLGVEVPKIPARSGTMATKPTRLQQKALENFAEALVLIAEGARLDGKGQLHRDDLSRIAEGIARASSAFSLDEIVSRALEKRACASGLSGSTAELLTLMDTEVGPLEMLLLPLDEFKALVEKLEAELGDV